MPGQWVEDPSYPSGWRWDSRSPAPDPNPTHILSRYAGGNAMPRDDQATPRSVYDPTLGADGGGRYADPSPIPAIDPDNPVEHVDQLQSSDGPASWTGSDPAMTAMSGDTGWTDLGAVGDLRACPTCGTGVHPDRLRS